ncbi:uncharacterized protein L199_008200 [Kwoniella botswanensis]|uniref:uncharacterized protein n=1 Tax=Kwoniella botswanensis TaxID=1268659 RepID=UPI00315C77D6
MAPPPTLPPKDQTFLSPNNLNSRISSNSRSSLNSTGSNSNSFVDQDLAEAVRDSVQIKSESPQPQSHYRESLLLSSTGNNHISKQPPLPSLNPLIPRRTPSPNTNTNNMSVYQPTHNYSHSSPDMSIIGQPSLPSTRMTQLTTQTPQNPFEDDEVEPAGTGRIKPPGTGHISNRSFGNNSNLESEGLVQPNRAKFNRSQTGSAAATSSSAHLLGPSSPTSGSGKTRTRRSMSSDSYGFNADMPHIKELTAGQKKAYEDKKGSRHADVIDTWDPTGLGSAMWHHSGPYDAAAPSRNQNLPGNKAPMQAFRAPPVQSPPPKGPTTISLSQPPVPPKDTVGETSDRPGHRRGQSGNRYGAPSNTRRVSGGGLTGQYSTSMPAGGGYFPNIMDEPQDEATLARIERQRERESKRQALKAAWGIDTPEPFEDFGGSPNDGTVELANDYYSPESVSAPLPGKPARSPGMRFGMGATSPPIREEGTSPTGEYPINTRVAGPGPGGVKRTKSLMQKIKTMRENPGLSNRSASPKAYSPSEGIINTSSSNESVPVQETKRPGFFSRTSSGGGRDSPSKRSVQPPIPTNLFNSNVVPESSSNETIDENVLDEGERDDELDMEKMVPSGAGSGFVLVESPSSKARALRALQKEQSHHHHHHRSGSASAGTGNGGVSNVPANRAKYLPTPPVAPVMPDFNDILTPPSRKNSPLEVPDEGGLKRKTSMVKKLKDRMAK